MSDESYWTHRSGYGRVSGSVLGAVDDLDEILQMSLPRRCHPLLEGLTMSSRMPKTAALPNTALS